MFVYIQSMCKFLILRLTTVEYAQQQQQYNQLSVCACGNTQLTPSNMHIPFITIMSVLRPRLFPQILLEVGEGEMERAGLFQALAWHTEAMLQAIRLCLCNRLAVHNPEYGQAIILYYLIFLPVLISQYCVEPQ